MHQAHQESTPDRALTHSFSKSGLALAAVCVAAAAVVAATLYTGRPLYGSADAQAVAQFAEFNPCATIRQFGAGEAYWHHGHVYECASAMRDQQHILSYPVAQ
jgi:putative intracellular protease/amidase